MFHPKLIFRIVGILLFIEAVFLSGSIGVSLYYGEETIKPLLYSLGIMTLAGTVLVALCKGGERNISRKDGYIVVTLCWVVFSLFGTLPYMLTGSITAFTDAFYETMSGFTTTGATILQDIEALPKSILFWRMMTHWVGGLGIVFFTVAVFPMFGLNDINLFSAESVGPIRSKLHPRISVTARWILTIYIALTIVCTLSLRVAGMGWFDAVCHSMSTIATGGFSTKQASIAAFNSPAIEYVLTFFMFVSGVNLNNEKSEELARSIQEELNSSMQRENKREALKITGKYIIEHVEIPITIVECGFLSNPEEEELLMEDEYQNKLAWGIYNGIMDYFYPKFD